ncbi:MAG: hypothetical protein L0Z50_19580 [Verrucomicrobiales bacterium]|nr:hypothetical protein [Verrucomicrobiales bacterium]
MTPSSNTIRKLAPVGTNWMVTTLAGRPGVAGPADGTGSNARFSFNHGLAVDDAGNLYVADCRNNTIRKGYPALVISSPGFNGGQFGFDLSGQAGNVLVVEGSTDLVNWLPFWTNTLTGPLEFRDPQSSDGFDRFYRARTR